MLRASRRMCGYVPYMTVGVDDVFEENSLACRVLRRPVKNKNRISNLSVSSVRQVCTLEDKPCAVHSATPKTTFVQFSFGYFF